MGTPLFLPPEVLAQGEFLPASDVYQAGIVLHVALTGHHPFAGARPDHKLPVLKALTP